MVDSHPIISTRVVRALMSTQHVERDFMTMMDTNKDGNLDPPEVAKFYESR